MKNEREYALAKLKDAFLRLKEGAGKAKEDLERDGVIQRFEFTFELAWKTLKEFCDQKGNSANNPRDIFRLSADYGFIDDPLPWFNFLDNRNIASHLYDEDEMKKVFSDLSSFVAETEKIIVKLGQA